MRHLLLLLVLALAGYGVWFAIGKTARRAVWRKVKPHIVPIFVIVGLILSGLVAMFYVNGINVL